MTTKELRNKIESIRVCGSGSYRICICYRNKIYYCTSHNSLAVDRMRDYDEVIDRVERYGYTYKQAIRALYNECLRANALGRYGIV